MTLFYQDPGRRSKYTNDIRNAKNNDQLIGAALKESKAYAELHDNHTLGIDAVDKANGNNKYASLAKSAYELHIRYTDEEIRKVLETGLKNNSVDLLTIRNILNTSGGNLSKIHEQLNTEYSKNQPGPTKDLKELEDSNYLKSKSDKFNNEKTTHVHMVKLTFSQNIKKEVKDTLEFCGMRFSKFRQEWKGRVPAQHLEKLKKSIEKCDHSISVLPKIKGKRLVNPL